MGCVVAVRAVCGLQGGGVAEPEGAEGGEDDKGECVAEIHWRVVSFVGDWDVGGSAYFTNTTENHKHAACEVIHPMLAEAAASSTAPSHQRPAERRE